MGDQAAGPILSPGPPPWSLAFWLESPVDRFDDKVGAEVLPRLRIDHGCHTQDVTVASRDRVARFPVGLARHKRAEIIRLGVDEAVTETERHRVSTPYADWGSRCVSHKALTWT